MYAFTHLIMYLSHYVYTYTYIYILCLSIYMLFKHVLHTRVSCVYRSIFSSFVSCLYVNTVHPEMEVNNTPPFHRYTKQPANKPNSQPTNKLKTKETNANKKEKQPHLGPSPHPSLHGVLDVHCGITLW